MSSKSTASTFRPQEALQPHVLAAVVRSIDAQRPQAVVEGGDLVDSTQANEFAVATGILRGGRVPVDSGASGYEGAQRAGNPDPLFYRPDADAPRYPGALAAAMRPVRSPGLRAPWFPVLGNHDALVAGELAPTERTNALATGDRALVRLDPRFRVPRGEQSLASDTVDSLLARGLPGTTERRSPDPGRRQLGARKAVERLRAASGHGRTGERLAYTFDAGALRVIVLDLTARDRGAGGTVDATTLSFLRDSLARAGSRPVIVVSHQPLTRAAGGEAALALMDADPHVVASLAGDTHHNRIAPRRSAAGGYWLIETASLADWPQQARALALVRTVSGRLALRPGWSIRRRAIRWWTPRGAWPTWTPRAVGRAATPARAATETRCST